MENKKYTVEFLFTAEFVAESDAKALVDAAFAIKYGIEETRKTMLRVVSARPIPAEAQPTASTEKESEAVLEEPAAKDETMPF